MEAHHQFFRAAIFHPVFIDVVRQCFDVTGIIVKVFDGAQRGNVAHLQQLPEHRIEGGAGAAGGILRIHRHEQNALAVLFLEFAQHARNRRVAVAHRIVHHKRCLGALAEKALQQHSLLRGMNTQWRTFGQPHRRIFCGGFFRACVEHHTIQDQPPDRFGNFHYARVAQEFFQIRTYGLGRGRFGRAEVDQQYAGLDGGAMSECRFSLISHE